jgi:hypothetical protein
VQEGHEGILLYPIWRNLSNCERDMRVFCCTQTGDNLWQNKTYNVGLTFVKACSDLLTSHQRKCDCAWPARQHRGFLAAER